MPTKIINGASLSYEEYGAGSETIFFAHGLLWNRHIFDSQIDELKDRYRCIAFDFRGQGESAVADSGYDMDTLVEDIFELIQSFKCTSCHYVGLSMGGIVGMRLAIKHPDLVKSLVLIGTSADPEPEKNIARYKRLNFIARWFGLRPVTNQVMSIMFGEKFLRDAKKDKIKLKWRQVLINNNRIGVSRAVTGVINRQGIIEQLDKIASPTLIMVGDQDVATIPHKSERMKASIKNSKLLIIQGAGHTASVEEPQAINAALQNFYNELS